MGKINQETSQKATQYFTKGYNCCESVFHACCEELDVSLSEESKKIATAFGGGLGQGCTCGALAGGTMVIGLLKGRLDPLVEAKEPACDLAKVFGGKFKEAFGSHCCSALKKENNREVCKNYVGRAVEILGEILEKTETR